jgi:hypothetical protein
MGAVVRVVFELLFAGMKCCMISEIRSVEEVFSDVKIRGPVSGESKQEVARSLIELMSAMRTKSIILNKNCKLIWVQIDNLLIDNKSFYPFLYYKLIFWTCIFKNKPFK